MGHGALPVHRKPRVAILATGDELMRAGEPVGPDLPDWTEWDAERRSTMELGLTRRIVEDPSRATRTAPRAPSRPR